MKLLVLVLLSGCGGTLYVKQKGPIKSESEVKTESTVTIKLDIADQINQICLNSKDIDTCKAEVLDLFKGLLDTIKTLEGKK